MKCLCKNFFRIPATSRLAESSALQVPKQAAPQPAEASSLISPQAEAPIAEAAAMTSSLAPGDIFTQPASKIVFNAPYDDKHTYHIRVSPPLCKLKALATPQL